jgi:5-methylthioribose kinase
MLIPIIPVGYSAFGRRRRSTRKRSEMPDPEYELLTVDTVADYVAGRPRLAERLAHFDTVREVGDGNLNLVFVVGGKTPDGDAGGLVVKQALPYVRADPSWPMSPARNHAEARALRVHGRLSPATVPVLYDTDPPRYAFTVEDLSDHRVWRSALNDGERHEGAAAALGRYVADVAFGTSALGVDAEQLKPLVAEAINPPLCKITELLIFSEPYTAGGRGTVPPASRADVAAYADDPDVIAAMGAAKWNFMTRAEALIHGDLHTGSVMVRGDDAPGGASTKAFDSEFAFYGPVGFDIGLLWANLVMAAARSAALGDDEDVAWRLAQAVAAWDTFEQTIRARWPGRVDPAVFTDRFLDRFLDGVRADALDAGAAEAARRVIGPYPVSDIETLEAGQRVVAVRSVLAAARNFLLDIGARHGEVAAVFDRVGDVLR